MSLIWNTADIGIFIDIKINILGPCLYESRRRTNPYVQV